MQRIKSYLSLMRFDRPIGIYLLLWPTLWALWVAGDGKPKAIVLVIFILGTLLTRAAGCVVNDLTDRKFDANVARTKNRPLVTGSIKPIEAVILFIVLGLCAFGLVLLLNTLTVILAVVGALLMVVYPFMKRITYLPQLVLGIAFSWGIPMAFAAETGRFPLVMWLLFLITFLWIVAYDTFYAMSDREDDLTIGVKSIAIFFGKYDRLATAGLQLTVLVLLLFLGWILSFRVWFFAGVLIAACIAAYQQYLIKDREPNRCFKAFLNNHWFGLVIFAGLFLNYLS